MEEDTLIYMVHTILPLWNADVMKDIFFKIDGTPDTGATQQMVHNIMEYMEK